MNDTYKKVILAVIAVGAIVGAWFICKPINEETESIMREVSSLTQRYNTLMQLKANQAQYEADIETNHALFEEKLNEFPSNLNQEYQIEFVQGVRDNEDIDYNVTAQAMVKPSAFYVLGGTTLEGEVAPEGTEDAGDTATDDKYSCYTSTMTLTYQGNYEGIKAFVNYVAAYQYRMTIDTVSVARIGEAIDAYTGSMTVNIYSISGKGREEAPDIDLDDINTGVDNLFMSGSSQDAVSKFASDNGEAIKNDYDVYVTVNPASSDTSGKVVGLRTGGNTVTSSKNESEPVSIVVSQEGSTYTVQYGIGANKEIQEFDPGEDLTVLIQSSEIKDADDANAVAVSVENSSDKTLYVKVAGDETASRVKITNKSGSVIVYR